MSENVVIFSILMLFVGRDLAGTFSVDLLDRQKLGKTPSSKLRQVFWVNVDILGG